MTITEVNNLADGTLCSFHGLVMDVVQKFKKDGGEYAQIFIADKEGSLDFPLWNNSLADSEYLNGKVVFVSGTKEAWQGKTGIKRPSIIEADLPVSDFIASYDVPERAKGEFFALIGSLSLPYSNLVEACILRVGDKFFTTPAAVKHHHNKIGGLFIHTMGAVAMALNILSLYGESEVLNRDSLLAKVILHDIGKTDEYSNTSIAMNHDATFDHLVSGAMLVRSVYEELEQDNQPGVEIPTIKHMEEICASILNHHGEYGAYKPVTKEDEIVHLCDMIDSRLGGN